MKEDVVVFGSKDPGYLDEYIVPLVFSPGRIFVRHETDIELCLFESPPASRERADIRGLGHDSPVDDLDPVRRTKAFPDQILVDDLLGHNDLPEEGRRKDPGELAIHIRIVEGKSPAGIKSEGKVHPRLLDFRKHRIGVVQEHGVDEPRQVKGEAPPLGHDPVPEFRIFPLVAQDQ